MASWLDAMRAKVLPPSTSTIKPGTLVLAPVAVVSPSTGPSPWLGVLAGLTAVLTAYELDRRKIIR